MARIPEYPPILNGSTELQIAQIREFLMRLVRDLADAGIYDESTGAAEIEAVDQKIDDLADSLADVATSGSYNDLRNKPTIPAAVRFAEESYSDYSAIGNIAAGATKYFNINIAKTGYKVLGIKSFRFRDSTGYYSLTGVTLDYIGVSYDSYLTFNVRNTTSSQQNGRGYEVVIVYAKSDLFN